MVTFRLSFMGEKIKSKRVYEMGVLWHSCFLQIFKLSHLKAVLSARIFLLYKKKRRKEETSSAVGIVCNVDNLPPYGVVYSSIRRGVICISTIFLF